MMRPHAEEGHAMTRSIIFLLALLLLGFDAAGAEVRKPGYEKCLTCHVEIKKLVKDKGGHSPFREFRCGSCHTPHSSRQKGLLKEDVASLCRECHRNLKGGMGPGRSHKPFEDGRCLSCHNPHASENPKLLVKRGGELCFGCHPKEGPFKARNVHRPVQEGRCLACHQPHGSQHEALTGKDRTALCASCHAATAGSAAKGHQGVSVAGSDCMSCHSPHGSDRAGLVKSKLHAPFGKQACATCHQGGGGREGIKGRGAAVCLSCHEAAGRSFMAVNSHVGEGVYCVSCHSPHASDQERQMRAGQRRVCRACHQDTAMVLQDPKNSKRHPMVNKGQCSSCHRPHGSNNRHMLADNEILSCTGCHKRHAAFSHPIGTKAVDPRSKRDVTCITCHDPMGTPEEYNLRFDRRKTLCVQCHRGY